MTNLDVAPAPSLVGSAVGVQSIEPSVSAVSWPAIIAGAVVAAATSLALLALGSGFGLASVSPFGGASPAVFTAITAIWLIVMQWVASGLGGYITGRLRTRWVGTHTHEVFFRDTAHGFLAWALATVIAVALFSSVAGALAGAGSNAVEQAAAPSAAGAASAVSPAFAYDVDTLFRSSRPDTGTVDDARGQAGRILTTGMVGGAIPADDAAYLAQLVVAHTGISLGEAQQRVETVANREADAAAKAKQAADAARKAASAFAIFTALSMIIGALIASVAAALGGQLRDEHP
jgi:hypothetical protein